MESHFPLPVLCWLPVRAFIIKCVMLGHAGAAYLIPVLSASRAGGFLGRWPHKPCQQKPEPLISPRNCSHSHWARLLPDVTQHFSIDSNHLFPNSQENHEHSQPSPDAVLGTACAVASAPTVTPSNIPVDSREAAHICSGQEPGLEQKCRYFVTL